MKQITISSLILLMAFFTSCGNSTNKSASQENAVSNEKFVEIARKAYVYGYPMILMDYTEKVSTNYEKPAGMFAPINQIGNNRQFPDDKFTAIVKPNLDTYYSMAWIDLKAEPIVFTVPASDRYYLMPLLDAYSNVFSSPGTRTTGTGAHTFLLTGSHWKGDVPAGMGQIKAPTNRVWLIGRTQVNSAEDGATVVAAFQDGLSLVPLSKYRTGYTPPLGKVSEEVKKIVPVDATRALSITDYFNKLAELMVDNPPAEADAPLIKEMESIGIVAGKKFSMDDFSPELKKKLNAVPEVVHQDWVAKATGKKDPGVPIVNYWMYSTDLVAFVGLGANLAKDAIYPSTTMDSEGNTILGTNKYVIHFDKDSLPPVNAFWSLTAYNSKDFLIANPINRFAIGDRDKLNFNEDGSLDIYIQNTDPGGDKTANWLPSTKEGLTNLTLRLYWPKESVLDGTWKVPGVKKVE